MENTKSKKVQRNSNNSDNSFSTPVASPDLLPNNNITKELLSDELYIDNKEKISINMDKDIEPSLETLILNLKIISKLKPGYKLSLKESNNNNNNNNNNEKDNSNNVYIDNSYFQYFKRILSDNSRQTTIDFLENLDCNISKKIENLLNENNNDMFLNSKENILLNLSHDLNLSLIGLNNLINTYIGDEYTVSKIEMIIKNFELKIRKITNILKVN